MSSEPSPRPAKVVRIKRLQISLNVLIQLLLAFSMVAMANYFAFRHYVRWDFTRSQKYTFSEQTTNVLKGLKAKANIYVYMSSGVDFYRDLDALLRSYRYASKDKIKIEFIEPYRDMTRARELGAKYKIGANDNVVILDYEGRHKFVTQAEMADYDNSGAMFGQPAKLIAFKGEQAITSAMLELVEEKRGRVDFLSGHGGPSIGKDGGIAGLAEFVERQNAKASELSLATGESIPPEVRVIVIAGARYDLSERELGLLRDFWKRQGRIFVALNPESETPRLLQLIDELGLRVVDDRVLKTVALGGSVIGVLKEVTAEFQKDSPMTRGLEGVQTVLTGGTKSMILETNRVKPSNIRLHPLLVASDGFWGEMNYVINPDSVVFFDPKKDQGKPLVVAASVEQGALGDTSVKLDSARGVFIGNAASLEDKVLTQSNLDFFLASLNWLMDREELGGIAPKAVQSLSMNLTEGQLGTLVKICMLYIPALVAALGATVWWFRRK